MIDAGKMKSFALLLCALIFLSCENDNSTNPDTVTSRTINVHLRANQIVTYRASFTLDGVTIVNGVSSGVAPPNSVINLNIDALSLPRGRHTIRATILQAVPSPSEYRMTASVTENNVVVRPDVPEVVAVLGVNQTITVEIVF